MANTRKTYTAEFKLQAVRQVIDQHLAVAEVARRLGITEGRLHDWLKAFRANGQRLKAERDIRNKAAAYFAGHST
jgi:transposase